jgi:hypothetical protein
MAAADLLGALEAFSGSPYAGGGTAGKVFVGLKDDAMGIRGLAGGLRRPPGTEGHVRVEASAGAGEGVGMRAEAPSSNGGRVRVGTVAADAHEAAQDSGTGPSSNSLDSPVDIHLHFKDGWTQEQRQAAMEKRRALSEADARRTEVPGEMRQCARRRCIREGGEAGSTQDVDRIVDLQLGGKDRFTSSRISIGASTAASVRRFTIT